MKSNNQINVPEARDAMDKFKMEAASEVGVNLKQGYNGDLTSREAGSVGGQMVKNIWPDTNRGIPPPQPHRAGPLPGRTLPGLSDYITAKHSARRQSWKICKTFTIYLKTTIDNSGGR